MLFMVGRRRSIFALEKCNSGLFTSGFSACQNKSKARVYVTGSDLWEHSKINDGWDPEANRKVDNSKRYPFLRTVTFGLNLTF